MASVAGDIQRPAMRPGQGSADASTPPPLPSAVQRPAAQIEPISTGAGIGHRVEQAASNAHAIPAETPLPKKLGRYAIRRLLGSGGMGMVYLAHDTYLDRLVAVKALRAELSRDDQFRQRFLREARLAAKLHNPNAVTVYDMGVAESIVFLAMEYVDGGCLETAVVSGGAPLPWPEATRAVRDAAMGLAAAHRLGLVHRDVKPSNLLRSSAGVVKVADFGLARAQASQPQLTQAGAWMGTPAYMAPEQWLGNDADARSDLYSLICTWYFLLTARPPYGGDSLASLGYLHTHEPFPDPRHLVRGIPAEVVGLLVQGAAKNPADRLSDADSLASELEALLDTSGKPAKINSPVVAAQTTDRGPQTPARLQASPIQLAREHTMVEVPPTPLQPTLIGPTASDSGKPPIAARRIHPAHRLVRAIRRVDDLLALVAGDHNSLLHGFLRAASVAAILLLLLVLLARVPFAAKSTDNATSVVVDADLDADLTSGELVLLKFGAKWSGPCRLLDFELGKLAEQEPQLRIIEVDVDTNRALAQQYKISSIPDMVLVRSNEVLGRQEGYMSADEIADWVRSF